MTEPNTTIWCVDCETCSSGDDHPVLYQGKSEVSARRHFHNARKLDGHRLRLRRAEIAWVTIEAAGQAEPTTERTES